MICSVHDFFTITVDGLYVLVCCYCSVWLMIEETTCYVLIHHLLFYLICELLLLLNSISQWRLAIYSGFDIMMYSFFIEFRLCSRDLDMTSPLVRPADQSEGELFGFQSAMGLRSWCYLSLGQWIYFILVVFMRYSLILFVSVLVQWLWGLGEGKDRISHLLLDFWDLLIPFYLNLIEWMI